MKKYTVHLINEQYYKFIGKAVSASDSIMIFNLQDGSEILFHTQHITLIEKRELDETK